MASPKVVSPSEYSSPRLALLEKEKAHTRARDALAAERRALPVVEVKKHYTFTSLSSSGEETTVSLSDLFAGRRQLIIYHFMFDPSWEKGCQSCSLFADHIPPLEHLYARSTSFVAVSRAPIAKIAAYKEHMGWDFPWVSSYGTDFNYDFQATQDESQAPLGYNFKNKEQMQKDAPWTLTGEQPGHSCFVRGGGSGDQAVGEEGKIYHTYSTYARGGEGLIGVFGWLDFTMLGRQDDKHVGEGLRFKRHDAYTAQDLRGVA